MLTHGFTLSVQSDSLQCMHLTVEETSIFLGCTVNSGNKIALISINKEIEGMNFMKEVGWRGEGQLMSI